MSKLEDLKKLAEAACGFNTTATYWKRAGAFVPATDEYELQDYWQAANPQTIQKLIDLCVMQNEQLRITTINLRKGMSRSIQNLQAKENCEALAAFESFERGE